MSKISLENKKGRITITNRLSYPETINERVYNAIASGMFDGFIPISVRQKRKEIKIECIIQGLIPLNSYFAGVVTKKMFLDFVHEIALQIKNCEKNMINANNLDLQSDRIFIDPQTKKVKCIFWPIVNNQRDNPPAIFLKQLPYQLNFNPYDGNDYLETYTSFFNGVNPFSVNNFDKMILKLSGKRSTTGHTPSEALSGTIGSEHKPENNDAQNKADNIEYDPFSVEAVAVTEEPPEPIKPAEEPSRVIKEIDEPQEKAVFCMSCGAKNAQTAKFCIQCGTKIESVAEQKPEAIEDTNDFDITIIEDNGGGTTVLGDDTGGTTVLGYDEPEEPVFPVLTRLKTDERVVIDKPKFRLGCEQGSCDWVISGNTFISRKHIDIITRDDRYYIIDLKSTNKTFIDGKVINAEQEVEIFSGTAIRLANEDFTFNIEV